MSPSTIASAARAVERLNRGPLAKQGRLTWLRNLIPPRSTSILKIPRKRPRPTARWTEILWPVWLAHFRRQTRSAPHSQGREPARQIHCGFADGAEPRSRSYAPEEQGRTDRCVIRTMRGEGASHPGLNCCASYWPISLLKAEVFSRSKSRSPVAA